MLPMIEFTFVFFIQIQLVIVNRLYIALFITIKHHCLFILTAYIVWHLGWERREQLKKEKITNVRKKVQLKLKIEIQMVEKECQFRMEKATFELARSRASWVSITCLPGGDATTVQSHSFDSVYSNPTVSPQSHSLDSASIDSII